MIYQQLRFRNVFQVVLGKLVSGVSVPILFTLFLANLMVSFSPQRVIHSIICTRLLLFMRELSDPSTTSSFGNQSSMVFRLSFVHTVPSFEDITSRSCIKLSFKGPGGCNCQRGTVVPACSDNRCRQTPIPASTTHLSGPQYFTSNLSQR